MANTIACTRTPLIELIASAEPLDELRDDAVPAWAGRLRAPPTSSIHRPGHEEVAMAVLVRAVDGGPLQTFSGALHHESGLQHCLKADRALGWEGEAQRDLLVMLDCEAEVEWLKTESVRIEGPAAGKPFSYTADVEVGLKGGGHLVIEVKRGPDDLRDPHLRAVLATVTEAFRRIGVTFLVVYRGDIWANRHHRRNAELLGATRLSPPTPEEVAIAAAAAEAGTTIGELAELLAPGRRAAGESKVRALVLRGYLGVDLRARMRPHTPLHALAGPASRAIRTAGPSSTTREEAVRPHNRLTRNAIIRIHGADHVYNGRAGIGLNIVNAATGVPYVERNADGVTGFIDDGRLADMIRDGEATVHSVGGLRAKLLAEAGEVTVKQAVEADPAVRRMIRIVEMLDDAKVPDGVLAVARHLETHWTEALVAEFGPADPPGTIRHWRRHRGVEGARHPRDMIRMWGRKRRGEYSSDFVAELLGQTILDAKSNGEGWRAGYVVFSHALNLVNDGRHPEHDRPDKPYRIPHADTYKRWWDQAMEEETELLIFTES